MLKKISTTQAIKRFAGATGVSQSDSKQYLKKAGFKSSMSEKGLEKVVEKSIDIAKKEGEEIRGRRLGTQKQRERISQAIQEPNKPTEKDKTPKTPEKDKKAEKKNFLAGILGKKDGGKTTLRDPNAVEIAHQGINAPQISKPSQTQISGSNLAKKSAKKTNPNQFEATSNQTPGFGIKRKDSGENEPPALQI